MSYLESGATLRHDPASLGVQVARFQAEANTAPGPGAVMSKARARVVGKAWGVRVELADPVMVGFVLRTLSATNGGAVPVQWVDDNGDEVQAWWTNASDFSAEYARGAARYTMEMELVQ